MNLQIVKTQTNMGKECLIVDGYTFRRDSILKSGEISWRCSLNRQKCKAKIRTDADSTTIFAETLDHKHPESDRLLEKKLVRNRLKRIYGFIRGIQWGGENTYNGEKYTCKI